MYPSNILIDCVPINHIKIIKCNNCDYYITKTSNSTAYVSSSSQKHNIMNLFRVITDGNDGVVTLDTQIAKKMIKELFYRTVSKYTYEIDKIEPVQCDYQNLYHAMYQKYRQRYKSGALERWLFHGTSTSILKQIETNGFDRNFNRSCSLGKV